MRASLKDMEQSLAEGHLVDYWKKDELFECVEVAHIQDICEEVYYRLLSACMSIMMRVTVMKHGMHCFPHDESPLMNYSCFSRPFRPCLIPRDELQLPFYSDYKAVLNGSAPLKF